MSFFFVLTVTFSKRMELRGRIDGEEEVLAEKMDKDL